MYQLHSAKSALNTASAALVAAVLSSLYRPTQQQSLEDAVNLELAASGWEALGWLRVSLSWVHISASFTHGWKTWYKLFHLFELQLSLLQDERGSLAPQHCLWTRNNIYRVSSTKQDLINSG